MNKLIELRRAKMLALSLLLIAAATFVVTLFLPPNFWVSGVKAIAEAAMAITAGLAEILNRHPETPDQQLVKSGMQIGHQIIGTTLNTLFFGFLVAC